LIRLLVDYFRGIGETEEGAWRAKCTSSTYAVDVFYSVLVTCNAAVTKLELPVLLWINTKVEALCNSWSLWGERSHFSITYYMATQPPHRDAGFDGNPDLISIK
jgi:hypothetical protein